MHSQNGVANVCLDIQKNIGYYIQILFIVGSLGLSSVFQRSVINRNNVRAKYVEKKEIHSFQIFIHDCFKTTFQKLSEDARGHLDWFH